MHFFAGYNRRYFIVVALAGLALRLFFVWRYPLITFDATVYGDIAKNWLLTGTFGMSENGGVVPTFIRLPGYPMFLGLVWLLSGIEHYRAVELTQALIDLAGCLVIAGIARQLLHQTAGRIAFALAALCPFLAVYAAVPQTETLSIFFSATALYCAQRGLREIRWARWFMLCGASLGAAMLVRPDGVILLAAIAGYVLWSGLRISKVKFRCLRRSLAAVLLLGICALAPLLPWTVRNWRVFHQVQPLAPRYANAPGEFVPHGFHRWVKTWIVDFVSTEEVFWKVSADVPGEAVDVTRLPARAFDDPAEYAETANLFAQYNRDTFITPGLDAQFANLAARRVRNSPLRFYLWLPLARVADMWLRPRTETLPIETRWWEYEEHEGESQIAIAMLLLNAALLGSALAAPLVARQAGNAGFSRSTVGAKDSPAQGPSEQERGPRNQVPQNFGSKERGLQHPGLMLTFIFLRSVLLATLENPEQRYTLECFPAVLALSAATLSWLPLLWKRFIPPKVMRANQRQAA